MASKWEKAEQEAKKHTTTFYCHFCAMKNVYFTLSCALIAELRWKAWEYFECDFCDHIGVECQGPSMIAPLKQGRLKMHKRISVFLSNEDLMRVYDLCKAEKLSPTQWISKLVRAGFEALGAGKRAPHGANRR